MSLPVSLPGRTVSTVVGFEQNIKAEPGFSAEEMPGFAGYLPDAGLLPADTRPGLVNILPAGHEGEPSAEQVTEPSAEQPAPQPAEQPDEQTAGFGQLVGESLPVQDHSAAAPNADLPEYRQAGDTPGLTPFETAQYSPLITTDDAGVSSEKVPVQLWRLQQQSLQPAAQYAPGPVQPAVQYVPGPEQSALNKATVSFNNGLVLQRLNGADALPPASSPAASLMPTPGTDGHPPALPFSATRAPAAVHEWAPLQVPADKAMLGQQLLHTLKDKVELQLNQQVQQARIKLDPPEMGRMELTVRLEGDRLQIQINASHAGIRDAITAQADRLRQDLLSQHGGGVEVNVGQQGKHSSAPHVMNDETHIGMAGEHDDDAALRPEGQGWFNALV